ncbi:uncharacterized protein LOC117342333 isoform X2 [Pecten maximus]|uniref:uncharacterized protein LOC117342333 isoform X2 n=2 Tax=Pecten maximus TaxID=6579 RepID=UPI00145856A4|nr:uncharacterized protein LOC117342333 isoform X2 [Pecten maximus]
MHFLHFLHRRIILCLFINIKNSAIASILIYWCWRATDMKTQPWLLYICFLLVVIFLLVYIQEHSGSLKHMKFLSTSVGISPVDNTQEFIRSLAGTNKSLTIITGFFDIGSFPKGSVANVRTPQKYENWLSVLGRVKNPVILYTDSQAFATLFRKIRNNTKHITKANVIERNTLWSFQIMPKIAKLYSVPGYPKHYPNTYVPAYTALTHSKLPVVLDAIKENFFTTEYYCWLDIGYFREIVSRNKTFWLEVPSDFDATKVGVTRVYNSKLSHIRPKTIIYGNLNWIGGGLFLGKPEVLVRFAEQYKSAVMRYLNESLMNVEQHILYSMFTTEERKTHPLDVDVQLYIPGTKKVMSGDPWFYLGYLMYDET